MEQEEAAQEALEVRRIRLEAMLKEAVQGLPLMRLADKVSDESMLAVIEASTIPEHSPSQSRAWLLRRLLQETVLNTLEDGVSQVQVQLEGRDLKILVSSKSNASPVPIVTLHGAASTWL